MNFASIDMFMDFGDWDFQIGRPVANEGFLKALLTYGTYDTYEFFCPDIYHLEKFTERMAVLIEDQQLLKRIKPSLQIALSESIKDEEYDVFHLGDFTYFMPYLVDMRNRYSRSPFPITGITHSLDAIYMNLRYLQLSIAGLQPYDGIICTSKCAEKTVRNGNTHIPVSSVKCFIMVGMIDYTSYHNMKFHILLSYILIYLSIRKY